MWEFKQNWNIEWVYLNPYWVRKDKILAFRGMKDFGGEPATFFWMDLKDGDSLVANMSIDEFMKVMGLAETDGNEADAEL